jgi:ligand-binding sensor domain-containing protein/two-component sensor histidine kinase
MSSCPIIAGSLLACQLIFATTLAQPTPHFIERLTTEEGLSSNTITDIAQDDRGFLWIATSDGLNRFDGTDITQFFHTGNENSLPHNFVYCLKKLPGNYLAVGTDGGLSFYDGITGLFHNFYYRSNDGLEPQNNAIISLEIDATGNIWALSRNCIFIFDPQHRFKKLIPSGFTEGQAARLRFSFAKKIWPLSDGNVLVYLFDGWRLYSSRTGSLADAAHSRRLQEMAFLHRLDTTVPRPPGFFPSHLFKVFDNYFLLLCNDTLQLVDEYGRDYGRCRFPYNRYPYILWSQSIAPIDSGRILFLFHHYGGALLSLRWKNQKPVLDSLSSPLLGDHKYTTALRDLQDNWWLATAREGLQKIVPARQCFTGAALTDRISHRPVRYEVTSFSRWGRRLWIATYGDGFFSIDLTTGRQQQYRLKNTDNETWADFVWNVRQIDRDTLWVGTQAGLFWYSLSSHKQGRLPPYPGKPSALDEVAITTQFRDSHNLVWMGLGKASGLCCYDSSRHSFTYYPGSNSVGGYPLRYPLSIAEDKKGDLWLTNDASNLLVRWQRASGRFTTVSIPASIQQHIGLLNSIGIEGDSILWLSSVTSGLLKFNPATRSLAVYGRENGLVNTQISSLYEDSAGRIWLMTEGGLACFDRSTKTFINYTPGNGLPVNCPTAYFFYDSTTRRLYNGSYGSYFYFKPDEISSDGPLPRPLITSVFVNGQPRMIGNNSPVGFSAQENDITIRYAAVDLTDGPAIRYAYRLMGVDTGWVMAGKQRQINFSHLAPGSYTFLVRAATGNGIWNREATGFSFRIYPPFTQTVGFYALLLVALGSMTWLLYRYRHRQLSRVALIRGEISRNLHDEVGANLTNISLSSLLAQKQLHNTASVGHLLERIYQDSQQVSESMREIVWSINPNIDTLGEALPRMVHYASGLLEANSIELDTAIAPEVESFRLSMRQRRDLYLIFKEAVNNMARHSRASCALIRFFRSGHALVMTIKDNGAGFDTRFPMLQNGLKNMQERARQHQWRLEITSHPGQGTHITLDTGAA